MNWLGFTPQDWQTVFWIILVGVVCNAACAILGCYLVLRRLSLLGDAISHAVLPGVALGFAASGKLTGWPILLGALAVGFLTAFLIQTLHSFGRVPEDASIGAVFTSLFAVGVILISVFFRHTDLDPGCVLYGQIEFAALVREPVLGLDWELPLVLRTLMPTLVATVVFVLVLWKELKICAFDPELATAMGYKANLIHYLLMGMVAVVTVAALEAVGVILVVAMLIVPAAAAHLLTDRLAWMLVWAVAIGTLAAVGGTVGAQYLNTNSAGMMAVAAGVLFLLAVFLAPRHGLVSKALHNLALSVRIAAEDVIALLYRLEEKAAGSEGADGLSRGECLQAAGRGLPALLAVPRLRHRGEIQRGADGRFRLTPQGRRLAQLLVRSHRLWETYLGEHFELPLDHLHEPASRVEHFISPGLQEELSEELHRPQRDPHGQPIPPSPSQSGS
jgi:manganese/zinc/iron transport system permease protein